MTGLIIPLAFSLRILVVPILASALLAGLLELTGLIHMPVWAWVISSPALYYIWFLLNLASYALETTLLKPLLIKPRRLVIPATARSIRALPMFISMYGRMMTLKTMPGSGSLKMIPGLRWLWYRAYSTSVHLGSIAVVIGDIYDPDITFIGQGSIIGDGSHLVAHGVTRNTNGDVVVHTAPIRIGHYVTIGGHARIEMGVTIGDGSLIEGRSLVPAFTTIPAGEVWAGSPAVFRRKREEAAALTEEEPSPSSSDTTRDILSLVAHTLNLSTDEVTSETSSSTCIAWDSIGQLSLSAAMHARFGISLDPIQVTQLRSISDIARLLKESSAQNSPDKAPPPEFPRHPELWPLLDSATATSALAKNNQASSSPLPFKIRICVAASFVAESLTPTLKLWCAAFGIEADIIFAGFNQLQAELLSSDSLFSRNREGLNVLLTRPEDLAGTQPGDMAQRVGQLLTAIEQFSTAHPLVVADLPPVISLRFTGDRTEVHAVRTLWRERLASLTHVDRLDLTDIIEELGTIASRDDAMETEASVPYSTAVYERLGRAIARSARRLCIPQKKVAAIDADGVLWGGVVGEDGVENLQLDGAFRQLQLLFRSWKEKGVLLVLVSRNRGEDVQAVFDAHPGMPLRLEDFAATTINWKPKSENLRSLAHELNLGLDSFVFIDDNSGERAEVETACPEIIAPPLPAEPAAIVALLKRLWCFDSSNTTSEDLLRTQFALAENNRKVLVSSGLRYEDYLNSLQLEVEMRPAQKSDFARVAQLTQKTNQFNLSLRRRTLGEIETLAITHSIWIVSARDRFGDYGVVGTALVELPKKAGGTVILDTFLLSCRALSRGVEETFLHGLGQVAARHQAIQVTAPYMAGPRNQPVREFFLRQKGFWDEPTSTFVAQTKDITPPPLHVRLKFSSNDV